MTLFPTPDVRIVRRVASGNVARIGALHRDGLGSVRAVTSDEGLANETDLYRPFGEQVETVLSVNAVREAKGYIGERYDADAGLLYLNARYYDPRLGMFLQPDWWEVMQAGVGTNRYSYAFGDPVNSKDPTGHWANPSAGSCGNCKTTPKGGYSSEINPERKRVQPRAGRVTYEKRPNDFREYGLHAQSRMGLAAAAIDDVGLDPNADLKAVAELASVALGPGGIVAGGRAGLAAVRGLWAGRGMVAADAALATGGISAVGGSTGMAAIRELGAAGEAAVKAAYDIGMKAAITASSGKFIPDGINATLKTLSEVKNVANLSLTRQLRGMLEYAEANGLRFDLYTRSATGLSATLKEMIDLGRINRINIPF